MMTKKLYASIIGTQPPRDTWPTEDTPEDIYNFMIDPDGSYTITVKTLLSSSVKLAVHPDDTMGDLDIRYAKQEKTPVGFVRFILNGRCPKKHEKLSDLGLENESSINAMLRLRGC